MRRGYLVTPVLRVMLTLAVTGWLTDGRLAWAGDSSHAAPSSVTERARADDEFNPTVFTFEAGQFSYSIAANGQGSRRSGQVAPLRFQLPLTKDDGIEAVLYLPVDQGLCLIYQYSDGEGAAGRVVRLDGKSLARRWAAEIPGFNVGDAVVEGNYLYLTALGFVGKLDLRTGRYAWQHRGLHAGLHFNSFERPEIGETFVRFTDKPPYKVSGPQRTVKVHKMSGARVPD